MLLLEAGSKLSVKKRTNLKVKRIKLRRIEVKRPRASSGWCSQQIVTSVRFEEEG